jgi:hypothetical protein
MNDQKKYNKDILRIWDKKKNISKKSSINKTYLSHRKEERKKEKS